VRIKIGAIEAIAEFNDTKTAKAIWEVLKLKGIFFGPTPVSRGNRIRPASAVTVFGRILGDTSVFKKVTSGAEIIIERSGRDS
jgi:hypothetical protein